MGQCSANRDCGGWTRVSATYVRRRESVTERCVESHDADAGEPPEPGRYRSSTFLRAHRGHPRQGEYSVSSSRFISVEAD
jgi:hypothetical protein